MSRKFTPKVVTANDLLEGDSIWMTADGEWTRDIAKAEYLEDADHAEARLKLAESQPGKIVGAYLADAKLGENGPEPTHFREEFRVSGPSNYTSSKHGAASHV
ncbi:DUF2849 domain-containing protein [Actibacterium lipolyticum]|uniref:DUF2849 domain-containing protein n=1 Tax=Actibacterium lipolyticum TaxID=1524263 RepID=A0A238JVN8_9RHOB|nr:DUF2849 domain-containing protein [Actibacterium lipolyticum]SMX34710.1 hypothetical protein COL8621_01450 [Actibacterium lipolyticum]